MKKNIIPNFLKPKNESSKYKKVLIENFERISDIFFAVDKNSCFTYMNANACKYFHADPETIIGKHIWTEYPEIIGRPFYNTFNEVITTQEFRSITSHSEHFNFYFESFFYPSAEGISVYMRDISEAVRAAEQIQYTNRLYQFVSHISHLIVRAKNQDELFKDFCRIAIEIGGFKLAWIGLVDEQTEKIVPVIHAGEEQGYFEVIKNLSIKRSEPEGNGPTGTAIRERRIVYFNNVEIGFKVTQWKKEATKRGFLSVMSIPLIKFNKVIGALTFYAPVKNFFNEVEMSLLEEVTKEVNFALEVFDNNIILKQAEDNLLKSEKRYQSLSEMSPVGIFHTNNLGETTYVNPRWCEITGLNIEVTYGNPLMKIIYPEDHDKVFKHWNESLINGDPFISEFRFVRPDGNISWVIAQLNPEKNSENIVVGYIGTITDITTLKKAQEEISMERDLSDAIINNLPGVFYLCDRERRFVRWNKFFELISQYSEAEIREMDQLDFFEGDEKIKIAQAINDAFLNGEAAVQAIASTKTRGKIPYYFKGKSVKYKGSDHLLGVALDFSDLVKAQEKIKENTEEIRQLVIHLQNIKEEERKRIAREIHDDLGQLLTAIKMSVAWAEKELPEENQKIKEKLKYTLSLINTGNQSIRRILEELRLHILEDYGLIEAMRSHGESFTESSGILLELNLNDIQDVLSDNVSESIFRIYQEALTNISRYSQAKKVIVSINIIDNHIFLSIEDNGIGFNPNTINHKKSFGITGIKERVHALKGNFELVSEPKKGTKILIKLPIQ